jgi:SAM-dependent methyltransferase
MQSQPSVTPDKIFQLGFGFMASKVLLSATSIGLFTELEKAPLPADAIRQRFGLHDRPLGDFLDTLVAAGILERDAQGVYSNTPEASAFLDRAKPSYLGGLFEMADARLFGFWNSFTDALRTGKPQNETKHGAPDPFAELYSDTQRLRSFLGAMTGLSLGSGRAIAQKFPWSDRKTFADVGCAQGGVTAQIALAHPHLKGVGFDLPPVKPVFEEYIASFGLADRVAFHPGSFFTDPLPNVDVILMGHVLHDWDLETKRMLIKKVYDTLAPGGAFIIFEALIDDDRRQNLFGMLISLNMVVETPGGLGYTGSQCQTWLKEVGFRETRVEHLVGADSMVVGVK